MICRTCLVALYFSLLSQTHAHVVPNMTIEAEFAKDRSYTLKMNLDPRVFLSDQPTSLPPVSADWYLSQTEVEKRATYEKAMEYLRANIGLTFNDEKTPLPACEFVALDGATYEEVKPDTAETHLLATTKAQIPAGADSFKIAFGRMANVSLILIIGENEDQERKPQVLFPGETSRPFKIKAAAAKPLGEPGPSKTDAPSTEEIITRVAIISGTCMLLYLTGMFFIRRNKR